MSKKKKGQGQAYTARALSDVQSFVNRMLVESACGAIVLGLAYLDAALENTLRTWLEPQAAKHFDSDQNGFLASYAAKWKLIHAMGHINDEQAEDFRRLGKVRNAFAHDIEKASFSSPEVARNWKFSTLKDSELENVAHALAETRPFTPGTLEKAQFSLAVVNLVWKLKTIVIPIGKWTRVRTEAVSGPMTYIEALANALRGKAGAPR